MANPDVSVVNQYGIESTRGTNVTAANKLTCSSIVLAKRRTNRFYRTPGSLLVSNGAGHYFWSEGNLDGMLSFEEIDVFLSMMFGPPSITNPGTGAYTKAFTVSSTPQDLYKTLTTQTGNSQAAREYAMTALLSLGIRFEEGPEGGIPISGDVMARNADTSASLDTVTTTLPKQVVSLANQKYYLDTTAGGLGGTQWLKVFDAELQLPRNKEARYVQDGSGTIDEFVETAMEEARFIVRAENNAQSRGFEDAMDVASKSTRYLRHNNDGAIITGVIPYRFRGNYAVKLENVRELRNVQATYGLEFEFRIVDDDALGHAMDFSVTNTRSTV